jgi:hypothetical protein
MQQSDIEYAATEVIPCVPNQNNQMMQNIMQSKN